MAVAETLGVQLVVEGMQKFLSDMKSADGAVGGTATAWEKGGGVISKIAGTAFNAVAIGAAAAVTAIGAVGGAIAKLAIDAAPLEGIGQAFDAMAADSGVSLDALRTAANGTISDFELMRMANVALTGAGEEFGAEFGENLPRLLEVARAASKATGQDVGFLFNSLVTGIKRSSPLLIDNTGLVLKVGEANQAMADQLGKSVEDLTAEEKQIALLNATLAAGDSMVQQFGGGQTTAAEQIAQFKAQIQNTKDEIGLAFLPVLQQVLTPLLELAQKVLPIAIEAIQNFAANLNIEKFAALGGVWAFIQEQAAIVVAWFQANLPLINAAGQVLLDFWNNNVVPALAAAWDTIKSIVSLALDAVLNIITAVMQAITGDWEGAWISIQQVALDILNAVAEYIAGVFDAVAALFGTSMQEIGNTWRANWEMLVEIVTTIWERIKSAITSAIEQIKSFFATADWGQIGKNIIEGIANGITGAAGSIAEAAKGAAQAALNAAKDFLGIQSPSSVFRDQIGRNISAGIALGIGDLAPAISSSIQAVTMPRGGSGSSSSVTNNYYNLTTNSMTRPGGLALEFAAMEMGSR